VASTTRTPDTGPPDTGTDAGKDADVGPSWHTASDAQDDTPSRGWRRGMLPAALLGLACLLMAVAAVALLLQQLRAGDTDEARTDALAAARDAARALFAYDHERLDEDFARGLAVSTGAFRDEYTRTTNEVVRPLAEEYDVVVRVDVNDAGVVDAGPGEATVLVFVNQITTSTRVEGAKIDQNRVRMHLVMRDGRWLVDDVDAL
jgi:Mce-associated membrane protein